MILPRRPMAVEKILEEKCGDSRINLPAGKKFPRAFARLRHIGLMVLLGWSGSTLNNRS
jgi:hypothetical protein